MKKTIQRTVAILSLIALVVVFFPMERVNAGRGSIEITDNRTVAVEEVDLEERSAGAESRRAEKRRGIRQNSVKRLIFKKSRPGAGQCH